MSKFLALVLRHDPARIGLELDGDGWADIDDLLLRARQHGMTMTEPDLRHIVATNSKQRFVLDDARRRIRANQGHSIAVDLGLQPLDPPDRLFHGTAHRTVAAIERAGLLPMQRQHVHLSADAATARVVGARHGAPVVFVVNALRMNTDGHAFFRSANGVWLVAEVPAIYLARLEDSA
ncbi:MAG TPA: RNA 2'-phosphotransferase [Acidimicrobiia bacterium]